MEFIIDYIVTGESGRHTLIGRCGDTPIHSGDEFQTAYTYTPQQASASRVPTHEVRVYVNEIQAYGQKLDTLGQGMTGSLVVSGSGIELLAPGMILGGQVAAETISTVHREDRS